MCLCELLGDNMTKRELGLSVTDKLTKSELGKFYTGEMMTKTLVITREVFIFK